MPAPNIRVPYDRFFERSGRHTTVLTGLPNLPPASQKLVAELIMMRMFDEWMESIAGVAYRLACGAPYLDGTTPQLLIGPASSTANARQLFEYHGRPKRQSVKWSKASYINESTKFVLDPAGTFSRPCGRHGGVIAEMVAVRNRIAHSNGNARQAFATVVKRRYGASLNHISPGTLLISARFSPPLVEQYVAATRAIAKDCTRA